MIPDHRLVRLVDIEMEDTRLLVIDPDDRMEMTGHHVAPVESLSPIAGKRAAL